LRNVARFSAGVDMSEPLVGRGGRLCVEFGDV